MGIKAIFFDVQDIGKRIKKSKRRFAWRFNIDGIEHQVQIIVSFISGKKKVMHNGNIIYEGKKVMTMSFQFPFNIGHNMCNIVQDNDNFHLRINNRDFDDLYETGRGYSTYGSQSSSRNENSYKTSSYEGYGSNSYSNAGGYSGHDQEQRYQRSQTSYPTSTTKKEESGWGDVKRATQLARKGTMDSTSQSYNQVQPKPTNEEPDFASEFSKFDYPGKKSTPTTSYSNNTNTNTYKTTTAPTQSYTQNYGTKVNVDEAAFDKHQNKYSSDYEHVKNTKYLPNYEKTNYDESSKENAGDFANFGNFGGFSADTKQQTKQTNAFDNFGGFSDFNNVNTQSKPEPQKQNTQEFFQMDFNTSANTNANTMKSPETQQQQAQGSFFGGNFTTTPPPQNQQQVLPQQSMTTSTMNQPAQHEPLKTSQPTGGLMDLGLDFMGGNTSTTQTQQQTTTMQPQSNVSPNGGQTTTDFFDAPQTTDTQAKKPKMNDLWDSNLVSLDMTEAENANKIKQQGGNMGMGYNNNTSYSTNSYGNGYGNTGYGGYNNNSNNNFNTQSSYDVAYSNSYANKGGFGGNNFNTNNNFNMGNMGMGMGMNMNMGGFNNSNMAMNNANFGGMNGNFNNNFSTNTGNMGFQQNNFVAQTSGGSQSTPFDF